MAAVRYPVLLLCVAVAGCGEVRERAAEPAAAVVVAPAAPMPTPEAPTRAVAIRDFKFAPRVLRVARGTRVTWTDLDEANHSVTFARSPGNLGNIREGEARSTQFTRPGTYAYVCLYHPSMRGRVVVQ
jgi:plastocyanin